MYSEMQRGNVPTPNRSRNNRIDRYWARPSSLRAIVSNPSISNGSQTFNLVPSLSSKVTPANPSPSTSPSLARLSYKFYIAPVTLAARPEMQGMCQHHMAVSQGAPPPCLNRGHFPTSWSQRDLLQHYQRAIPKALTAMGIEEC